MPFVYKEVTGVGFYETSGWKGARGIFTTRKGGISPEPFHSLNLGAGGGDDQTRVEKNRELLAGALGVGKEAIKTVSQVHGDNVYVVRDPAAPRPKEGYDALITDVKGVALGVLTADCVPILLYDPVAKAVGSVHAGWAGTIKGIAGRAVVEMATNFGSSPLDIKACIGPSIGACCYEVDEKVMTPLRDSLRGWWEELAAPSRPGHWLLDLWKTNRKVLQLAGIRPENISVFGVCTSCNPDKFYSHRKSMGSAGRMMALTMLED